MTRVIVIALCLLLVYCGTRESAKFNQYYVHGERLYISHCSNCHQTDGSGLGRVYPPLDTSDYMRTNFRDVICSMRHGKKGAIIVNGIQYNQPMPGIPQLTDLDAAQIATYIYNTWSHKRGIVEVREVTQILSQCESLDSLSVQHQ